MNTIIQSGRRFYIFKNNMMLKSGKLEDIASTCNHLGISDEQLQYAIKQMDEEIYDKAVFDSSGKLVALNNHVQIQC